MRWKWLLVLPLIALSVIIVNGDDVANDEVLPDENDRSYDDEQTDGAPMVVDELLDTGSEDEKATASAKNEDLAQENEDTVDVENVAIGKQKGKYMAYDDYFLSSALDGSDNGYNWNGESHYF